MSELTIYCDQLEPGLLRVADVTPLETSGYPPLSAVTGWRFTVLRNNKPVLMASTDDARSKPWLINTREHGMRGGLESDVYTVQLDVIGLAVLARRLADYHVRTPLKNEETIWLKKNGAWFHWTDLGSLQGGDWTWSVENTYDRYESYQIRCGDKLIDTDAVLVNVIQEATFDDDGVPAILLSGSQTRVFCRTERVRWAQAVLGRVRTLLAGKPVATSYQVRGDVDKTLHEVDDQLDLLEQNLITDPGLARQVITLTKTKLAQCS